ncbi:MAG: ABC transporter ATP-binding protein [Clostridia bacterium]|nr:ABC transporter ATP-binding protein [Clostridia bacterium]
MEELVLIENLSKNYGEYQVLKNVNLTIQSGKIIGLLGQNGAGKTTLIKLMNDLLKISSGKILIKGHSLGVETKKIVSYLPEKTYLDKSKNCYQTIKFFKEFYENFDTKKAETLLKDLNIDLSQKISKMSKGMQEKVQLVLVMSRKADLYILDEPLGGVDPATRDYILDTILTNFNENASIIISTHLISDIERILDEVIFLHKGEILLHENADMLREKENKSIDEIFREKFRC